MRKRRHPLSGALYEVGATATSTSRRRAAGACSRPVAQYLSGDVYCADPHMCLWLAGPQVPGGANMKDMPVPAGFDG